jgi:hypothetical protein
MPLRNSSPDLDDIADRAGRIENHWPFERGNLAGA